MTKDVIAIAEQAGMPVTDYGSGPFIDDGVTTQMLEKFTTLVRNAALEEAKKVIDTIDDGEAPEYRACQEAIESLKEPT